MFEPLDYSGGAVSWRFIVYSVFPGALWGGVCLLMLFYGLLHSWLNAFAEAMRFADRRFYMVGGELSTTKSFSIKRREI